MVRPVIFLAYSGEMRWRTRAGDEITATLGTPMTKDQIAQAWRTALDPAGEWISRVLEAADKRLTEVRRACPTRPAWSSRATTRRRGRTPRCCAGSAASGRSWCCPTTRRRARKIAAFAALRRPLDGRGADGVRGRGRAPAGRRRVRDQRVHRAVLRPGGRPVRPGPAARRDRVGVPALGAGPARASRPSSRPNATTWSAPAQPRTPEASRARRGAAGAGHPGRLRARRPLRGAQGVGALRPGALRRRRVRHRHRRGLARGRGLPGPARPARSGPGPHPARASARHAQLPPAIAAAGAAMPQAADTETATTHGHSTPRPR